MYFWKCWRDTRYPIFAFCGGLMLAFLFYLAIVQDWFGLVAARAFDLDRASWERVAELTLRITMLLMPLSGFLVAGEALPQEFSGKTLTYLLSRPRMRAYFLWVSWAIGGAQLLLLILVTGLIDALKPRLATMPKLGFDALPMLKMVAAVFVMTLVIYSMTFAVGVLLRSARNSVRGMMIFCFVYATLAPSLASQWDLHLPTFAKLLEHATLSAALPGKFSFPLLLSGQWLAFTVVVMLVSQWSFSRFEPEGA